jgi:hypothetical protein
MLPCTGDPPLNSLTCPACDKLATVSEENENALCLCSFCGQCLQVPSPLPLPSSGGTSTASQTLVPPTAGEQVSLWFLLSTVAIGSAFLGGLLFLDIGFDPYCKILGASVVVMVFIFAVRQAWVRASGVRSQAATRLELSPEQSPEMSELGPPVAAYQTTVGGAVGLILVGVISVGFGALGAATVLNGNPEPRWLEVAFVCTLAGLITIGTGIRNLLWRWQVLVFRDGLAYVKGRHVPVCRWQQIEAVYQNWTEQHEHRTKPACKIVLQGGEVWQFDGRRLDGTEKLIALIEQETVSRLLPKALDALSAGATIDFGPLGVGAEGLVKGFKTLPWAEVAEIKTDRGELAVIQRGKWLSWYKVPLSEFPNLRVFLSLQAVARG